MWNADIQEYSTSRGRDPKKVHSILLSKGWEPAKYQSSMKNALFDFLDQWYTLSIKTLPTPATLRRNPANCYRRYTKLDNGWKILTESKGNSYITRAKKGSDEFIVSNKSQKEADNAHLSLIKEVMHD